MPIRILPPALMNQIAAGEVVERPASVIKELVENSLDAGASRVEISIQAGGRARILVLDNGHGIDPQELELAVTRHATSKIAQAADLTAIHSFGFRGEALPSIASVSRMTVSSAVSGKDAAFISVDSGKIVKQGPVALAQGTRIEVTDLFLSVPARLKFLKKESTENRRCQDIVTRLALAHANTAFSFTVNGKQLLHLPFKQGLQDRLAVFWPPAICEKLYTVDRRQGEYSLKGMVGSPDIAQSRADRILLYVNNRPVQDKLLLSAVRQAYSGKLLSKEYPQAVLFLSLPPDHVDVNVHPAKQEVRFADESSVFTIVRQAIFQALAQAEGFSEFSGTKHPALHTVREPSVPSFSHSREQGFRSMDLPPNSHDTRRDIPDVSGKGSFEPYPVSVETDDTQSTSSPCKLDYLGQIANTYLIFRQQESLLIIDQHAAHERVLLTAMRSERNKGNSQTLAVPFELSLHPSEALRLQKLWNELRQAGFLLQTASGFVQILGIPPSLHTATAVEYLRAAMSGQAETLDDLWIMLSCKAAIKAGQPLARDEALSLIETWLASPEKEYCPHGRPIVLSWTPQELEKLFKRK